MILKFLSKLFKIKRHGHSLHTSSEGSNNAKETKKIISNPQKQKQMKKDKPNLPASSQLKAPAAAAKVVKKAVAKKVVKAVMKKAAKKKY
jgi:hypothetical protein